MKYFFAFLGVLVLVFGLTWIAEGNDFFLYQFFAPKRARVERQVFEQTPSFVKGQVQELENMQVEYLRTTDAAAKAGMASIILHRASGFNLDDPDVPQSLRTFISQLKEQQ